MFEEANSNNTPIYIQSMYLLGLPLFSLISISFSHMKLLSISLVLNRRGQPIYLCLCTTILSGEWNTSTGKNVYLIQIVTYTTVNLLTYNRIECSKIK
jgi:hypothetical protein